MDFIANEIKSEGMVKIRIEAVGGDLDRVACRYPVSFMDEMARQLTSAIEAATGTKGIADSSVQLVLTFATTTFMEHISGNVTYRRLMLVDAVSAPRDFWIKWTRLDNCDEGYNENNILFELGEDVEQKIRQREYRYLLQSGGEKYHNSMGRKKVTEWREVIKRAAKRGEISFVEQDFDLAPETLELEERIADLLGKRIVARAEEKKEEIPYIRPEDDDFARAMAKARMVVEGTTEEPEIEVEIAEEIAEEPEIEVEIAEETEEEPKIEIDIIEEEMDEADQMHKEEPVEFEAEDDGDESFDELIIEAAEDEEAEEADDELELDIFLDEAEEAELRAEVEKIDIFADEEPDNESELIDEWLTENRDPAVLTLDEVDDGASDEEMQDEPLLVGEVAPQVTERSLSPADAGALPEGEPLQNDEPEFEIEIVEEEPEALKIEEEPTEEPVEAEPAPVREQGESIADRVADIRAELETKIRLEYESRARIKAEEELVVLRRELQRVKSESESIISDLVKENERLRVEYEHLLEETERDNLLREAEAARRRVEEEQLRRQIEMQLRREASERERLAEAARLAIEEQRRLEAENARIAREREEEERLEAERARQLEEQKAIEAARQEELERIRKEEAAKRARAKAAMPTVGDGKYSSTNKTVKFLFRRSVDPNITTRIQEIIKATVDYYGKDNVYLKIKATVTDSQTVILEFINIPIEEMELLGNIIKIIGNSGLGVAKAIVE